MTELSRPARAAVPLLALLVVLAACRATGDPSSSEAGSPASTSPSAAATDSPTPEPTGTPSATPVPSPSASPSPSATEGGFTIEPNAEADALFLVRDDCENVEDGYRVEFPDEWWTNTAFADVQPCRWFSPTFYEVTDSGTVPAEIAIVVEFIDGGVGMGTGEILSRHEGIIGRTQPAVRMEVQDSAGQAADLRQTAYIVQLGPTVGEGPNLVIRTTTEMGGDYALNVAVLDRLMATMELIGTID